MKTSQFAELNLRRAVLRTKLTLPGAAERRIAEKFAIPRMGLSGMPLEWLAEGNWKLPSGKGLPEFALQSGFLAPLLFNGKKPPVNERGHSERGHSERGHMVSRESSPLNGSQRMKNAGKGSSH